MFSHQLWAFAVLTGALLQERVVRAVKLNKNKRKPYSINKSQPMMPNYMYAPAPWMPAPWMLAPGMPAPWMPGSVPVGASAQFQLQQQGAPMSMPWPAPQAVEGQQQEARASSSRVEVGAVVARSGSEEESAQDFKPFGVLVKEVLSRRIHEEEKKNGPLYTFLRGRRGRVVTNVQELLDVGDCDAPRFLSTGTFLLAREVLEEYHRSQVVDHAKMRKIFRIMLDIHLTGSPEQKKEEKRVLRCFSVLSNGGHAVVLEEQNQNALMPQGTRKAMQWHSSFCGVRKGLSGWCGSLAQLRGMLQHVGSKRDVEKHHSALRATMTKLRSFTTLEGSSPSPSLAAQKAFADFFRLVVPELGGPVRLDFQQTFRRGRELGEAALQEILRTPTPEHDIEVDTIVNNAVASLHLFEENADELSLVKAQFFGADEMEKATQDFRKEFEEKYQGHVGFSLIDLLDA